jgi:hypothetical membrane protein
MFKSILYNLPLVVIVLGSLQILAGLFEYRELELLSWFLYSVWSLFYIGIEIKNQKQLCSKS